MPVPKTKHRSSNSLGEPGSTCAQQDPEPHSWHPKQHAPEEQVCSSSQLLENNNRQEHAPHTNFTAITLEGRLSPPPPHVAVLLLPRPLVHDICDPRAAQALECLNQLVRLIELLHVVAPTNALPLHEYVGNCASARHLRKGVLQLCAQWVLIELDNVRRGSDCVFIEENVFCALGKGAVGFGEYDDWLLSAAFLHVPSGGKGHTWTLLQNRVELNLYVVVLGRLVLLDRRLALTALCSNAGHRRGLVALNLDAAGDRFVVAFDSLVVLCALLVGHFLCGVLGGFQACAYAVCVPLLGGFGELVLLQRFLRPGVKVRGVRLRA